MRNYLLLFPLAWLLSTCPHVAFAQQLPLSEVLLEKEGWELVAEGYKFTEGPAVDATGNVYFTDVPNSKIYKIHADSGKVSLFVENSDRTNGLMFAPNGKLYGCRNGKRQIAAFNLKGEATPLAEDIGCNDITITRAGGVYFTEPSKKQVWYLDPHGKKRIVDTGIELPNGLILSPGQETLIVGDTRGQHLWAFRVEQDGRLTHKQPFYSMRMVYGKNGSGADGMTVDREGRVYVATYAGLQVFDQEGRLLGVIDKPQDKFLSNVVFGGPKLDTLYVTCTDRVYRRKVKTVGQRLIGNNP